MLLYNEGWDQIWCYSIIWLNINWAGAADPEKGLDYKPWDLIGGGPISFLLSREIEYDLPIPWTKKGWSGASYRAGEWLLKIWMEMVPNVFWAANCGWALEFMCDRYWGLEPDGWLEQIIIYMDSESDFKQYEDTGADIIYDLSYGKYCKGFLKRKKLNQRGLFAWHHELMGDPFRPYPIICFFN